MASLGTGVTGQSRTQPGSTQPGLSCLPVHTACYPEAALQCRHSIRRLNGTDTTTEPAFPPGPEACYSWAAPEPVSRARITEHGQEVLVLSPEDSRHRGGSGHPGVRTALQPLQHLVRQDQCPFTHTREIHTRLYPHSDFTDK